MWVSRKEWDRVVKERNCHDFACRQLVDQNRILQVNLDWFRVRLTQIEKERSIMYFNQTGVKMPAPEYVAAAESVMEGVPKTPYAEMPSFDGMTDDEAKAAGVGWDAHGNLIYQTKD